MRKIEYQKRRRKKIDTTHTYRIQKTNATCKVKKQSGLLEANARPCKSQAHSITLAAESQSHDILSFCCYFCFFCSFLFGFVSVWLRFGIVILLTEPAIDRQKYTFTASIALASALAIRLGLFRACLDRCAVIELNDVMYCCAINNSFMIYLNYNQIDLHNLYVALVESISLRFAGQWNSIRLVRCGLRQL